MVNISRVHTIWDESYPISNDLLAVLFKNIVRLLDSYLSWGWEFPGGTVIQEQKNFVNINSRKRHCTIENVTNWFSLMQCCVISTTYKCREFHSRNVLRGWVDNNIFFRGIRPKKSGGKKIWKVADLSYFINAHLGKDAKEVGQNKILWKEC